MEATGLSTSKKEYRARLAEQSDDQIDAWAAELMRDVVIRRGVIKVIKDFRKAARLDERGFERVFASGGGPPAVIGRDAKGRLMVPAITLFALAPGIRSQVPDAPRAADRVPRRELRGDRLRLGPARPVASRADVVLGHVRLTHPFPSLLDGLVAAAAALAAGGEAVAAVRLGVSMVLLQASVGALNDLIDAPSDAGRKPGKPIPAGLVRPASAKWIALLAGVTGVLLAVPSGWATVGLAVVLLGLGYGYDLWFKGTAWSWLPFALAIPLFPTYGWLGAAGSLPPIWAVLLPTAMLAGAALAVANAMVDVERDRAAGLASVAIRLGRDRAALVNIGLLGVVWVLAVVTLGLAGQLVPWGLAALGGGAVALAGWRLLQRDEPSTRERGWEAEAVGVAVLAAGWLAAMAAAGLTAAGYGRCRSLARRSRRARRRLRSSPGSIRASRCCGPSRSHSPA